MLGAAIVSAAIVAGLSWTIWAAYREMGWYRNNLYFLAFLSIGMGVLLFTAAMLSGRVRAQNLLAGALLPMLAIALFMQKVIPGGTYIALWPLVFAALGLALFFTAKDPGRLPCALALAAAVFVLPAFALLAPSLHAFSYTLTYIAGAAVCALAVLLAALLLPQMTLIPRPGSFILPSALLGFGLLLFCYAHYTNRPSAKFPLLNCLSVGADFDKGQAWYLSADRKLDAWTGQFFQDVNQRETIEEFIPGHQDRYLKAPAPLSLVPRPVLEVRGDRVDGSRRILNLFFDSSIDSQDIDLIVISDNEVHRAIAAGHELAGGKDRWRAHLRLMPLKGIEIELEVDAFKPLDIFVQEKSQALPKGIPERYIMMAPEPNRTLDHHRPLRSEHTYSRCTFRLGDRPKTEAGTT